MLHHKIQLEKGMNQGRNPFALAETGIQYQYTHIKSKILNLSQILVFISQSNRVKKRTDLEKVINSNNLCILNNQSPTYLNPSNGSYSTIDITLSDPSGCMDYSWKVHDDPCGCDHFSIILEITQTIHDYKSPPCWKTN